VFSRVDSDKQVYVAATLAAIESRISVFRANRRGASGV
jgi:hypothetical protein